MIPVLLLAGATWASGAQDAFAAGAAAERAGDPAAAAAHFAEALERGGLDPHVYHGLGNALFRQGRTGRAIAAWRRGQALAPRDGDIAANLDRARRATRDRLDPPPAGYGPFFWQAWLSSRDSALAAGIALALALGVALVGAIRRRPPIGAGGVAFLVAGVLLGASTAADLRRGEGAVVVVSEVVARSAVGPAGVDLFALHEGAEVRVVERAGNDVLVALPDERKGWLPAAALLSTDPEEPFPTGG